MKTPVSKPVLAIAVLGLALSAFVVWFGLHSRKPAGPEITSVAVKNSDTPSVPKFLNASPSKKIATASAPAVVAANDNSLPVIPISLAPFLDVVDANVAKTDSAMMAMPHGAQTFGGINFLLEGALNLQGLATMEEQKKHYRTNALVELDAPGSGAEKSAPAALGKSIACIYLLAGGRFSSVTAGDKMADVVWYYDDNSVLRTPLQNNIHVRDWWRRPYEQPTRLPNANTKVAWHSAKPSENGRTLRLYRIAVVNPRPDKTIRAIGFNSAMNRPSLFVAALTLDPLLPGVRPDNLTSEEAADPELNGQLQLYVQDANGQPLPGAEVKANFKAGKLDAPGQKFTTDQNGQVRVHYPDTGLENLEASAEYEGFSGRKMKWDVAGGDKIPDSYTLKLSAEVKISGLVVDEADHPISGAKINLYRFWRGGEDDPNRKGEQTSFSSQIQNTDAQGRWQAGGLPVTLLGNIGFGVTHPDFVGANDNVGDNPTTEKKLRDGTYQTVLKQGATVKGRVVDGAGGAVSNATVWAGRKYNSERQQTTADAGGKFSFRNLPDGELPFTAMSKGFAPAVKMATVSAGMAEIIIRVQAGKLLQGHVQDESSQPVANARVGLENNGMDGVENAVDFTANTDAKGNFTWDGAPDEELTFYIFHDGFEAKRNAKLKPGAENIITLQHARTLTGLVLDAATEQPVTKFSVRTGTTSEGNEDNVYGVIRDKNFSAADGRFKTTLDEESDNAALVTADGYESKVEKFSPGDSGSVQVTARLKSANSIEGVVLSPDGTPAPGVTVAAAAENGRGGYIQMTGGRLRSYDSRTKIATTDDQGHFKLTSAPDKGLIVAAGEAGFARQPVAELKGNATIRLEAWGRIEGTLKIGGEPGVGKDLLFTLQLAGISTDFNGYKSTTDAQGKFTIEKVPPGEGSIVRLIKTSASSWSHSDNTTVQVKADETTQVSLGDNGAVIAGRYRYSFQPTNETPLNMEGSLMSQLPMPSAPSFTSQAEAQAFFNSPAWKAASRRQKHYTLELLPGGGFTADNVAAGDYSLNITVHPGGDRSWSKPTVAEGSTQITVPESFNPATPIDAGEVLLQPPTPQ